VKKEKQRGGGERGSKRRFLVGSVHKKKDGGALHQKRIKKTQQRKGEVKVENPKRSEKLAKKTLASGTKRMGSERRSKD